ncbi:hypothetical protein EVAR_43135_1 [Eumeta japonica]|uniref:Uncharacterized protein n=1 Tax=Eumeta variegata TaxID=151549 RepID=A0A4C1XNH1_EUMVA|nr:hypothetical protein EVAR_43135_1 [Eumeta japonica]
MKGNAGIDLRGTVEETSGRRGRTSLALECPASARELSNSPRRPLCNHIVLSTVLYNGDKLQECEVKVRRAATDRSTAVMDCATSSKLHESHLGRAGECSFTEKSRSFHEYHLS